MKKLKLFFACLLMAVLSIGQVWAAEELKATLDFTSQANWNIPTSGTNTAAASFTDGTYTIQLAATTNYKLNSGYLILGKSGSSLTLPAFEWTTTKILVTGTSGASTSVKQNIFVGSDAVSTETTGAQNVTNTYEIASASQAAGTIYILKITSAHNTQIAKIEIYGEGEGGGSTKTLESLAISGDPTKTSYYAGQDFDPAGLTVTGTYSDQSQSTITSGITWSFNPAQALELGQTSIQVKATVGEVTSADWYLVSSLSVTEAPAAVNYEKVTSEPADWSGEYILVYEADASNARVWKGADQANNYAEATISNGVIAAPEDAAVLNIAKVAESDPVVYTIMLGDKYIGQTSNANGIKIQATAINNSISYNGTDAAVDIVASSAHLRYNSASSSYFRYYKSSSYSSQKKIQLYKKVDGTVKPAAGLAYAEADQKKLAKLGDAFTAPTLDNPNQLTVTYASDNTDVAEVASNGAVTIKAVGVAVITASFAGNDDYKAGDASYTIAVTNHAGTAADPFVAADAKIVIDAFETFENVHVSGIVSQVLTSTLPAEGYISFNISDGGAIAGQQTQAYKCKSFNGEAFTAITDVETGATVIVAGNLKKYQSTYEFDQNCYLVSYTAPAAQKQSIANTKETAYSVAQALVYAADGVTYDLDDYVYIQGVVFKVESFNSTNGTLNIFIKDANAENQFEFFKCAGINDGESTTPFEALTDVQEGDEVIGYGQMMYYQQSSIYEFKQGNYLVDLNRPEVAVTGVALDQHEATIEVGESITLVATVSPDNASDKSITWTVESGSDKASVADGVVTGLVAGEAVIRAASPDYPYYDECTVTVVAADPTKHVVTFDATEDKTTEDTELSLTKGALTIDLTEGRFNNETDYRVYKNAVFTVSCSGGNIIKIEFECESTNPVSGFGTVDPAGLSVATGVWTGNASSVEFTADVKQVRINTITITYKEDNRDESELAWSTDAVELTVGDAFTAPTLSNPNNIDASAITIASNNPDLAVVNDGVVSLVAEATGEATITATFAGNDDYKPATVSYTITVNAASPVLTDYYQKVTETAGIVEGTYLLVYEEGSLAFNGGLTTLDAESNTIAVDITADSKIGVTGQTAAATFYIEPAAGTVKSASNYYIGVGSWSNGLKQTDKTDTYIHNVLEIDGDGNAQVGIYNADWNTTGGTMRLQYNKSAGQTRFRYYKNGGQQPIALYKLANEVIKPAAGLAWDPAEDITLIVGDAFTAPTLLNPNNIDAAEITIESSNTDVATINAGVVELVENATGTTTITATFAGNASYKPATVSYKIKVNPANSIYVSTLNVNFGSVAKDATVEDKVITVTLTGVPAASVALAGDGASAFSIDKAALTESGDITISASSATAGTFNATLTISDDEGVAASKEVSLKLIVSDPAAEETPISTSTEWVVATAADLVDGAEVIITGVKNEVVYAMGEQKSTNRAAYAATVDGEGVLTPGEGTMAFTLVAQDGGTYALRTSDGKYLYAAGDGANHLKTQAEVDVNAKWTLAVNSAVAEGSTNRNIMRFNGSGTNNLFSCYSTGQTEIKFYVPKPVTPPTPAYVDVRTGLEPNHYYTICYPNAMSSIKGATLWSFIGKDAQYAYLVQETASTIEAGKPYIMYATASTVQAVLGDETNAPGANGAIHGTFENLVQEVLDGLAATAGHDLYLVIGDELRRATGAGTGSNTLPAQRAYVIVDEIPAPPANMPAHVRRMPMQTDQAQGFENIEASDKPMKLMIDGQMYILRGEKVYDATGRLVK